MLLDAWLGNPRARLFSPFFGVDPWALERASAPAQVVDTGDSLVVTLEIPGVPEADVQLTCTGQTLTVTTQRTIKPPEGYVVHQQERRGGPISRSFRLPVRVDAETAKASVKDGILTVTLPRAAAERQRTIPVQVPEARPTA